MKQKTIFGILMSLFMTCGMELYNNLLQHPQTDYSIFLTILKEACMMTVIVYILSGLIGNPYGARFAQRHYDPEKDPPYFCRLLRQAGTVSVMCPMMSLVATLIFQFSGGHIGAVEIPYQWMKTLITNFPMAFFWNFFFAAPLVHTIMHTFFAKEPK